MNFADLRVAVSDPTDDDYNNVDILLKPKDWVYDARIYDDQKVCTLFPEQGRNLKEAMRSTTKADPNFSITLNSVGPEHELNDSEGNQYTVIARGAGYRLRCNALPSHSTIKIIFAVATTIAAGPRGRVTLSFLAGINDPLDILGPKPSITDLSLAGKYTRGIKPHFLPRDASVKVRSEQQ